MSKYKQKRQEKKNLQLKRQQQRQQRLKPKLEGLSDWQLKVEEAFAVGDILVLSGPPGTGKSHLAAYLAVKEYIEGRTNKIYLVRPNAEADASWGHLPGPQPLTSKILTSKGWTIMGQLKVGDEVIGRDGLPTRINSIYPKGIKSVYKVITNDDCITECCEDHLWYTTTRDGITSVKSLKDIKETLLDNKGKLNHKLPRNQSVQFEKNELPLAPYTLGVLLGDGTISNSHIRFYGKDKEIANRVNKEISSLGLEVNDVERSNLVSTINVFTIRNTNKSLNSNLKLQVKNPIRTIIKDLGLSGKKAYDKFIPDIYKYSSIQDRIDLIRGLMDTDGNIKINGEINFTTTSKRLAEDVVEVVRSLGGRSKIRIRNRVGKSNFIKDAEVISRRVSYEFNINLENINPFYLSRKSSRFKRKKLPDQRIKSIEYIGEKEVQCIYVDNPEHLYITDDYIVTHNTLLDKMTPFLIPYFEFFKKFGLNPEHLLQQGVLEPTSITHIKGRTLDDGIVIYDEAQDSKKKQFRLVVGRLGPNAKLIITGDPEQAEDYNSKNNTFKEFVQRIEDTKPKGIISVKLTENQIVRHPMVSTLLNLVGKD